MQLRMNKFRSLSSKKKRSKKKLGTASSLSLDVPGNGSFDQSDGKLKFSWVKSENLEYGIFCGQSAAWESTVYFKNGGSDEVYEYSIRYEVM